ncbi:26S proteasome non-ATPase regulatory subunit 3 [Rhodotorula toruloides ATCC 204091]|uniref:BY PROTMAP: gi/342320341/gb/EGU12282.1/ 26S proteasome non-ATPase regulatory subunit 3 [Rhodotorula glutinis ATCC 204091] n=1 Tax=Rhodotorula toruloides TaxID=5286 RepID=A0A0K3CSL0_RHOTO|nr:26S proteasome non-ATPase regulatory subunit 3 [Rhodotorula toruloides ATCC 204091]KAK4333717.1 26S proteasome regulatory subunit RPN3 [Rhodotorula toruloides]
MASTEPTSAAKTDSNEPATPPASDYTILAANVTHNLSLLHQAVSLLEPRFTTRALRSLPEVRKKFGKDGEVLAEVIRSGHVFKDGSDRKAQLIKALGDPPAPPKDAPASSTSDGDASMEVDSAEKQGETDKKDGKEGSALKEVAKKVKKAGQHEELKEVASELPEGDAFVCLLVVISLLDQKKYEEGKALATNCLEFFGQLNRRTLDQLLSKFFFYWVRLHEVSGDDTGALRPTLLAAHRTASLRHDTDLQATLLPLLLRNYLEHGLYEQADKLVSKTQFPEGSAQNSQLARWYYYLGRIRAIQLNYTAAHTSLEQAIRRAPSDLRAAPGFFQHAYKLHVLVTLLMGDIPERKIFREVVLKKALRPYLEITQAVRVGDIQAFNAALSQHTAVFTADRTLSLVHRLRHNVIKTALRTISLAYSRISLRDISTKLALDSEEDAEYIVAKAIRDGVVVAKVDHEKGEMTSRETGDVYSTGEPMREFDRRIGFLLDLYNQSVKSMRYPMNAHSKELASAKEARERERELAKEIEEGDSDADLDGPGDMDSF